MGRNQGSGRGGAGAGPRPGTRFVGVRALATAQGIGNVTDQVRLERVRTALREGKSLPPMKVTIRRDGRLEVVDGRHRLAVLREPEFRGRKVEVTFRRGG